jgi:surface protein
MQEGRFSTSDLSWTNINADGWGVQLTNKSSTADVTTKPCTYINGKPVVSMAQMFQGSKATTIDVGNFDTSNVTDKTYARIDTASTPGYFTSK